MKVLVSGSHGLIGRTLVQRLRRGGHEVVRLLREGAPAAPSEGPAVRWAPTAGQLDTEGLVAAGPFDGVVHLAGAGIGDRRWTPERRRELVESRVRGTAALAAALADLPEPPAVLVSASAVGYYGDRGDEVLDETSGPGEGFLADLCLQWEAATAPAARRCRVVLVRSGVVLAADGGALARQLPLFRLGLGGRLGSGRQYVSWIGIEDEVALLELALTNQALSGPLNSTAPEPVTNAELTATLARVLHRPAPFVVPRFALALALGPELVDEALLASQRVHPGAALAAGFGFAHPDLEAALRSLLRRP